jgi:hypothetical protein
MNIIINRIKHFLDCTIGEFKVYDNNNLIFECYSLEDIERPIWQKVDGKTAIPRGNYVVIIDYSVRFKREMPHILKPNLKELDNFKGIRIHPGNTSGDTEGCILIGKWDGKNNYIIDSRITFNIFFEILKKGIEKEAIIPLTITGGDL